MDMTDDEKIDVIAARILKKFKPAFEELAKWFDFQKIYKKLQELEKRYNKFQPLENLFSYYLAINGKEI